MLNRQSTLSTEVMYNNQVFKYRTTTGELLVNHPEQEIPPPNTVYGHVPGVPVGRTWDCRYHISSRMHDGGLRVRAM